MNVIIVIRQGVSDTPILVKHDNTADAVFRKIAEELLEEDFNEVDQMSDNMLDEVNGMLEHQGIEIEWYVDVEVNTYKN